MTDSTNPLPDHRYASAADLRQQMETGMAGMEVRNVLAALCRDLRGLCRPEHEGGAAAYVRLASDDPMDHDPDAGPVLAVPVVDVLRLLEDADPATSAPLDHFIDRALPVVAAACGKSPFDDYLALLTRALRTGTARPGWPSDLPVHSPRPLVHCTPPGEPLGGHAAAVISTLCTLDAFVEGTADGVRAALGARTVGVEPLTRTEVVAALAELYTAGDVEIVQIEQRPYYQPARRRPDPELETAVLVPIAEHLAQAGPAGATADGIVEHLRATYLFTGYRQPTAGFGIVVLAALADLGRRQLAVLHGRYYAPGHAPVVEC